MQFLYLPAISVMGLALRLQFLNHYNLITDETIKTSFMKKLFYITVMAGILIACNDAAETTDNTKDSLDSIANEKKDVIDSTAEARKDRIDSTTEMRKDALDRRDSIRKADTTTRR